jgi:hypothetical protein
MILNKNTFIASFLQIYQLQNTNQIYLRHSIAAEAFTDISPVKFQSGNGLII